MIHRLSLQPLNLKAAKRLRKELKARLPHAMARAYTYVSHGTHRVHLAHWVRDSFSGNNVHVTKTVDMDRQQVFLEKNCVRYIYQQFKRKLTRVAEPEKRDSYRLKPTDFLAAPAVTQQDNGRGVQS